MINSSGLSVMKDLIPFMLLVQNKVVGGIIP